MIGAETDFQGTSISGGNQGNYALALFQYPLCGLEQAYLTPSWPAPAPTRPAVVRHRARPRRLSHHADLAALWHRRLRLRRRERFRLSTTPTGWTAGGGVEWMFAPHWSAKAEYLYVDLSNMSGIMAPTPLGISAQSFQPQINVVRAGVNYHFNWGARLRSSPSIDRRKY